MNKSRVLCWFSCGAASAVAAKLAVDKYGSRCEVIYCDTSEDEHPDNKRFLQDIESWIDQRIIRLKNNKYEDRWDVYAKTGWLFGNGGARCTVELKKRLRFNYQRSDDIHILGYTLDEQCRIERFKKGNPELFTEFILIDNSLKKEDCLSLLVRSGIDLPKMYLMGYANNNCIGCVKGGERYWRKIKKDFPEVFNRMAQEERRLNYRLLKRCFLDELKDGKEDSSFIEILPCSVFCELTYQDISKFNLNK